jgi:hypothetical protein
MGFTQNQKAFHLYFNDCTLRINNQVNKTMGITIELKITSQVFVLIEQILSFLASSVAWILNCFCFDMRIIKFEVEILAGVGGFPVNFSGQCHPSSDGRTSRKCITLLESTSILNWM